MKNGLWHSLDALKTPAAVLAEWQSLMGADFPHAQPFLDPTSRHAGTYPCTHQPPCRCWHELRPIDHDTMAARCTCRLGNCPPIRLATEQVAIHELSTDRLGTALREALRLDEPPPGQLHTAPGAHAVGTHGKDQFPAILIIGADEPALLTQVAGLVATMPTPFLLLTPTGRHVSQNIDFALRRHRSAHLALSQFLQPAPKGTLVGTKDPKPCFARLGRDPASTPGHRPPNYTIRREGKLWSLVISGAPATIPDTKGIRYVAYLLRHPDDGPLHAIDLVAKVTLAESPNSASEPAHGGAQLQTPVQAPGRTQDRSHSLDDAVLAQRIRAKEQEWEAVLDDPDATEPEKAEAERYLAELHEFQKTHSTRSQGNAEKLVRSVRAAITRLQEQLSKATDDHGHPHQALRAFSEHIAKYIITPSARYSKNVRSTARTGLAGRFTYEPPPSCVWNP